MSTCHVDRSTDTAFARFNNEGGSYHRIDVDYHPSRVITSITPKRIVHRPERSTETADLPLDQFIELTNRFLNAGGEQKHSMREKVLNELNAALRLNERLSVFVGECLLSSRAERLDDAIDVLSDPRVDLPSFLQMLDLPSVLDALEDDIVHVLVRAAGRRSDRSSRLVDLALECDRAVVRESAIEAIADRGDSTARRRLTLIAETDQSPVNQELALELIADLDEE